MINDYGIERGNSRFQFQPELLFERRGEGGTDGILSLRGEAVRRPFQLEIVRSGEAGFVE